MSGEIAVVAMLGKIPEVAVHVLFYHLFVHQSLIRGTFLIIVVIIIVTQL